jgi:hypothetical protein
LLIDDLKALQGNEDMARRVLARLACKIIDHRDLENKLASAPPHLRQIIYDTVRPKLRFIPYPLDIYIARAGVRAEHEQLPTMGKDGQLEHFHKPEAILDAENAVANSLAKLTLTLVCAKCTFTAQFHAVGEETKIAAILKARRAGWVYDFTADPPVEICPGCPTSLRANA